MPDGVINFRKAKKRVKAARKEAHAQENRLKFGRTKAEKLRDKQSKSKVDKFVDDHKREE